MREVFLYILMIRELYFHPVYNTNRLGQLFIIDV